jgi:hypothetical protein
MSADTQADRAASYLQRGVEAECELSHCVDEEGREPRPGVTGRRKMGVKQAATLLDRSFLLYPVLLRPGAGEPGGAPAADFRRIHFGTG